MHNPDRGVHNCNGDERERFGDSTLVSAIFFTAGGARTNDCIV